MNFVGKQDTIQHFVTVTVARIRTSVQGMTKTKNNQMKEFDSPRGIEKDGQTAAFLFFFTLSYSFRHFHTFIKSIT